MTQKGIIQKVIDPIIKELNDIDNIVTYHPSELQYIIRGLKQELIEEIRVRSRGYNDSYEKLVMLEDLIGDGKE